LRSVNPKMIINCEICLGTLAILYCIAYMVQQANILDVLFLTNLLNKKKKNEPSHDKNFDTHADDYNS
jgi:hypothetical protein